jgi:oxygen-independent coproporphyrinogen III oxidase
MRPMAGTGIYIHIPFCKRQCFYCHFTKSKYDASSLQQYVEALAQEIRLRAQSNQTVETLYFGGGSPSLLNQEQMGYLCNTLRQHFKIDSQVEFTVEMNPEDVTLTQLKWLKQFGVNRLSIGTQSFLAGDLQYLQRTHGSSESLAAIHHAMEAGFDNFNIDFIISLPTQDKKSIEQNFKLLQQYDIPHVSAYILEDVLTGEEKISRDDELYFFTRDQLQQLGYEHYEVSNYCKPKSGSRHNLRYWYNQEYIGIGLSASGFERGIDYKNTVDFRRYFAAIKNSQLPVDEQNPSNISLRRIIMGFRLLKGIKHEFIDNHEDYKKTVAFLEANGMLVRKGAHISVHPDKILLLNEILTYFL